MVMGRAKKRQQYEKHIIKVDINEKKKKGPDIGSGKKTEGDKKVIINSSSLRLFYDDLRLILVSAGVKQIKFLILH